MRYSFLPIVFVVAAVVARAEAICFASLPSGHSLEIRVQSTGCFGGSCRDFEFLAGAEPKVRIFVVQLRWSEKEKRYLDEGRDYAGTVYLSSGDLLALDGLLDFYRQEHSAVCTNHDLVSVQHFDGSGLVSKEVYEDGSCEADSKKGILTFPQLVSRLSENRPNKSLEPTPTAVTRPADAGRAPASGVAHL